MHIWRSEEEIGYPGLVAFLSSLEECLFKFLVFFFFKLSRLSLLLNFKSSLYILDNRHSCFKSSHLFNYSFIFLVCLPVYVCMYVYIYVYIYMCVCVCVCVCVCTPHVCLVLQKSQEGIGFPGTAVTGGYELPYGWQELSVVPLWEQQVLLTFEASR